MDNTLVIQGLKIVTKAKYLKFTKSDITKVIHRPNGILEILFRECRKSSDIVGKGITLHEDLPLEETKIIKLKNVYYRINGIIFRKIVLQDFVLSVQFIKEATHFLIYKNDSQVILIVPPFRVSDLKGYIKALECTKMLEYVEADECAQITNISSLRLGESPICFNSEDRTIHHDVSKYTEYVLAGVDVIYFYLEGLRCLLREYGMDLLGYPIDKTASSSNYIRWKLTDKDKHIQRKSGFQPLKGCVQCKSTLEMEVNITDLEMFEDFMFKYQNYELITNYTSWYATDSLGRKWLCSALYDPIPTDFDSSAPQAADGTFAFQKTFTVNLYYYIVKDTMAYKLYGSVASILQKASDPLDDSIIKL